MAKNNCYVWYYRKKAYEANGEQDKAKDDSQNVEMCQSLGMVPANP